jgi:hypothetical protein
MFDRAVAIVATAVIAGAIIVGQLDLVPQGAICWSVIFLGRECAGCGLTRSFAAIGRGDFAAANDMNPLGPILFVWLVALVVIRLMKRAGFRHAFEADLALAGAVAVILVVRLATFYLA